MPTRPGSDVIPLRKETKARLHVTGERSHAAQATMRDRLDTDRMKDDARRRGQEFVHVRVERQEPLQEVGA